MFRRARPAPPATAVGAVLGVLASNDHVVVGSDGRVHPGGESLVFEWVVGAADGWHRTGELKPSAVSQRLVDGLPVVETTVRVPGGHVVQRAWCVADGGAELAVLEVENRSKEAVSVALSATTEGPSGSFEVTSALERRLVAADRDRSATAIAGRVPARLVLDQAGNDAAADSSSAGPAPFELSGVAQVWPLAHTASLRVAVVLDGEWEGDPERLPDVDAVLRGWQRHLDAGARVAVPDPGLERAVITARAGLLVRAARPRPPTEAAGLAAALGAWGHHDAAVAPIEVLLEGQRYDGSFDRDAPEATATALAAWAAHVRATGSSSLAARLAEPAAKAAHRLGKVTQEPSPPWFSVAQEDAAAILEQAEQPDAAALCRQRVGATVTAPSVALADVLRRVEAVGGTDLGVDVAFLHDLHRILVDDAVPGVLTIVPDWPDEWLGADLEVHRLPTRAGLLSAAVRWHGARPALLWEVVSTRPVELAAGLDPSWRSTEAAGEALLGPVEPAGGLPGVVAPLGGVQTSVDDAPDDGVSFR